MKKFASKSAQFAKKNFGALAAAAVVGLSAVPSHAAAILDFTAIGTKITEELTPAIAAAMPIAGIVLACGIGWKLYKRFARG
jgi:hypothetical protein